MARRFAGRGLAAMSESVALVCADLLFTSKIVGTAQQLGISIQVYRTAADVRCGTTAPAMVIVDLASPVATTSDDLRLLRNRLPATTRLLAYGSHVEVERLRAARAAGCDPVLARSEFSKNLPTILRDGMAPLS